MAEIEKPIITNQDTIEEVDEESLQEETPPPWKEKILKTAVQLSSTQIGQFAIKQGDKVLWTVEKTAKWSCPEETNVKKQKTKPATLIRPLPWILFLPALVTLRYARVVLSLCSILTGHESVEPADLVVYIQTCRRKLRAIKYQGLRNIRLQRQENELRTLTNGGRQCDENGVFQDILTTILRGVCIQRPEVIDAVRLIAKQKNNKSALNVTGASKSNNKNSAGGNENDSETDDEDLRALLERSLIESDSDDDSFEYDENEVNSDEDYTDDSFSGNEEDLEKIKTTSKKNKNENRKNSINANQDRENVHSSDNNKTTTHVHVHSGPNEKKPKSNHSVPPKQDSPTKLQNGSVSDEEKSRNHNSEAEKAHTKEIKRTHSLNIPNSTGNGSGGGVVVNSSDIVDDSNDVENGSDVVGGGGDDSVGVTSSDSVGVVNNDHAVSSGTVTTDGVNDDTFYSPIGSPIPDNENENHVVVESNSDIPQITEDRDLVKAEAVAEEHHQEHSQQFTQHQTLDHADHVKNNHKASTDSSSVPSETFESNVVTTVPGQQQQQHHRPNNHNNRKNHHGGQRNHGSNNNGSEAVTTTKSHTNNHGSKASKRN